MGSGEQVGQRGNSHLIGAVLLVEIVMAGALVVLLGGQAIIDDTQSQGESELAGQTLRQMDSVFQSGQDNSDVDVPDELEGDLTVNESSTWRLRLNGNSDCVSGDRGMGSMQYTDDEGRIVGYEGGGVWRYSEGGATMDSPPDLTYENGSLTLAFPNVTGSVSSTRSISASSNSSRSAMRDRNLSTALYTVHGYDYEGDISDTDVECHPSDLTTGTLWINDSQFAGAWANYFETNYDEPRVTVETAGPVKAGDPVKVQFELGDVTDPEYEVSHVNVTREGGGDPVEIKANITNTGGLEGEQTVDIEVVESGTTVDSKTISPAEINSVETVEYRLETRPGAGDYTVSVSTDDDSVDKSLVLDADDGVPSPSIDVDAPQNASVGEDATLDATVHNGGDMTAVRTVYVEVDGDVVETGEVEVAPGDSETVSADLPTDAAGKYDVTTETQEDSSVSASNEYYVGDRPYFEIDDVDSPDSVPATTEYELGADIENRGDLQGEMEVNVTVEDLTGSEVDQTDAPLQIDGQAYTGGSTTGDISLSHTFRPSEQGRYRYVVQTPNETSIGTFTVGEPTNPNYVIEGIEFSRDPAWYGEDLYFNVTVENNGGATGAQEIEFVSENGSTIWTEAVVLDEGERTTIRKSRTITRDQFDPGFNRLTASTENATDDESLYVEDGERIDDGNGSIEINKRVRAEITVLGAELEGRNNGYPYISHTPTHMWLDVTNGTTGEQRDIDLFTGRNDGDVNHPAAERDMIQSADPYDPAYTRDNPYKYGLNLSEGSELSLFAESRHCYDTDWTDVVWYDIEYTYGEYTDANTRACTNPAGTWISASKDHNPQNVVIRGDGDEVPSFGAAHSYQRGLEDMLGSRIEDDGTLSLADGERVFLYELSKDGADPENAGGSGDPDYNDAVALFKVTEVERDVEDPANIVIEDASDVPSKVPEGERETFSIEVTNIGEQTGSSNVLFDLDRTVPQQASVEEIEPGETQTVRFTVPGTMDAGDYDYELNVGSNPHEERHGSITVGSPDGPNFQLSQIDGPSVVERGSSPIVTVRVTNTGSGEARHTIALDRHGGTERTTVELGDGEHEEIDLDLPTPSDDKYYEYDLSIEETAEESGTFKYWVGDSEVHVEHVEVGTQSYSEADLVERREMDSLSVKLENRGSVGDSRDVTLAVENDSGTVVDERENDVQLGEGRIGTYPAWVSFNFDSLAEGYYDYAVTVEDGGSTSQTWSGEIYIQDDAEVGSSHNSSSPIGVDSSEVVISG